MTFAMRDLLRACLTRWPEPLRWRPALLLLAGLACASCAHTGMHRTSIGAWDTAECRSADPATLSEACKRHSIERHVLENGTEYKLAVVEFDDQGWYHHARQVEVLFKELHAEGAGQDLIVSVFVHGWKHGASYCDDNLCCYRALLEQLVAAEEKYAERAKKKRRVFGIYVGWRGRSLDGPDLLQNLSFWDRKNTATQVALGSVRELFGRLREFHEARNASKEGRNRLFITGHSFGGLIVYNSVAQSLMESALAPGTEPCCRPVKGYGDLVVLVNPAFEAARYEPLHHIAQTRRYARDQDPVFISVTSRDDLATALAFPAGRQFSTVFETYTASPPEIEPTPGMNQTHTAGEQHRASLNTMGHLEHYVTHRLEPTDAGNLAEDPPSDATKDCRCSYLSGLKRAGEVDWKREDAASQEFNNRFRRDGHLPPGWKRDFVGGVSLRHLPKGAGIDPDRRESPPDSPFWVVGTSAPIVTGHNQFWTSHLLNFLRQVYDDILRKGGPSASTGK